MRENKKLENKGQNTGIGYRDDVVQAPAPALSLDQSDNPGALSSYDTVNPGPQAQVSAVVDDVPNSNLLMRLVKRADVILAVLLLLSMIGVFVITSNKDDSKQPGIASGSIRAYETQQIPLDGLSISAEGLNLGAGKVIINGVAELNNGLVVTPSPQPAGPTAGQIY